MTRRAHLYLLLVPLALAAGPPPAHAWPLNGVPLCVGSAINPTIVSDGAGGAIVAWSDGRNAATGSDVYAAHVLAGGALDLAWPANGRALCTASGDQVFPAIAPDSAAGAIVAWADFRGGATDDIYAQHVLASGAVAPSWIADGAALCTAVDRQLLPQIVADGVGGAIVTWLDVRNGDPGSPDIYAQRVLASGLVDPAWPVNGVAVCTAPSDQSAFRVVTDGSGGVIVTWQDLRNGGGNADIYAQRVLASGHVDPAWPANGRAVCTASANQTDPAIGSDGAGGAIVAWEDHRAGNAVIYAQHVQGSGVVDPAWPSQGQALTAVTVGQEQPQIVIDGAGGAVVGWLDWRDPSANRDIYAQHVSASGVVDPAWPAGGRGLVIAVGDQNSLTMVTDGAGGAIAAWVDSWNIEDTDLHAQHVLASGAIDPTTPNGLLVCDSRYQWGPRGVADGTGGAIITWTDLRGGRSIYAQRVYGKDPVVSVAGGGRPATSGITLVSPSPAPDGVRVQYGVARAGQVRLDLLDVTGRVVATLADRIHEPGRYTVSWDGMGRQGRLSPGLYLVRLVAPDHVAGMKLAIVR